MVKIVDSYEWDEICRRASGRRRYNAHRSFMAEMRRAKLAKLFDRFDPFERGTRKKLAKVLGVSEATISRDLAVMLPLVEECPTCHQFIPRTWWREA